jgi:hypothetical protein
MLTTKSILLLVTALFACSSAFVSPSSSRNTVVSRSPFSVPTPTTSTTTTALAGRRWNFNEGQGPWGLKKNAEIWNGRVSQVRIQNDTIIYTIRSLARWIVLVLVHHTALLLELCLIDGWYAPFLCEDVMRCDHARVMRMQCTFLPSSCRSVPPFV